MVRVFGTPRKSSSLVLSSAAAIVGLALAVLLWRSRSERIGVMRIGVARIDASNEQNSIAASRVVDEDPTNR